MKARRNVTALPIFITLTNPVKVPGFPLVLKLISICIIMSVRIEQFTEALMKKETYQNSHVLSAVRDSSPFKILAESGLAPQQIKLIITDTLAPLFEDKAAIEMYLDMMVADAIAVSFINQDSWSKTMLHNCLGTYHAAKRVAKTKSLEACVGWNDETVRGLSTVWSVFHLQTDMNEFALEEFAHDCLRNIGVLVESCCKPYLKSLLHQTRILRNEPVTIADLNALDLGKLVEELIQKSGYGQLFSPPPWNLKLSQWRNIAQHVSFEIVGGQILCSFGRSNQNNISLTRDELFGAAITIKSIFNVLKTAYTAYFMDNFQEIQNSGLLHGNVQVRPEMDVLSFALAVGRQGFEVVDFSWSEDEVIASLQDMSNMPSEERRLHAAQLSYNLWQECASKIATIKYIEKDGTPNLRTSIKGSDCEKVANLFIPFEQLAMLCTMVNLKTGETKS